MGLRFSLAIAALLSLGCLYSCSGDIQVNRGDADKIDFTAMDTVGLFASGIISTPGHERDLAISADGREIMYTVAMPDNSFRAIVRLAMDGGNVLQKEIAPFSGRHTDIEPFYSPDGQRVYFASTRPMHETDSTADYNIWYAEKRNGAWDTIAFPLDTLINSDLDEFYPSVAANGNLYFTAAYTDAKGREDIYVSRYTEGQYGRPEPLASTINTGLYEFNAYISPEEDLLIFSSYGRPDDFGGGDLYYSKRDEKGMWRQSQNMGAGINSAQLDYCPFLDRTTNAFYFTSNRRPEIKGIVNLEAFRTYSGGIHNGLGNIYVTTLPVFLQE